MSDWIYGIVAVMLFGTVILQMTPEGTYQKYVRLFLGALLMMTVIGPLYSWGDLSEGTRLYFEQEILSSWMGAISFGGTGDDSLWQEPDRWENIMREQVNQKQESWVGQVLETTVREYGFLYLDHEVQWNAAQNWPEQLTLWLGKQGEEKERGTEAVAEESQDIGIEEISSVDPVASVTDGDMNIQGNVEGDNYYEPSELRPLHQALQMVWQLEEGQIVLYLQR